MPVQRNIVRVFLASPGDLVEERRAVRSVINEWNDNWAENLGYQIELVGWEETVSSFGRPQHLINQDLDSCELFIGMMWKKWGTPPDNEGNFTSGFHEEFSRSVERRNSTGEPQIALFFKSISDGFLSDPGDGLKKVLKFRKSIVAEKSLLFQEFLNESEVQGLVRKCVTQYIQALIKARSGAEQTVKQSSKTETDGTTSSPEVSSPLSIEGLRFLENFVEIIKDGSQSSTISPVDVARFRLLANCVTGDQNDARYVGTHDINLLFENRNELDLGSIEKLVLTRLGFQNLKNENTPVWYWYSSRRDHRGIVLI